MKKLMALLVTAAAMTNVHAATPKEKATETVLKAIRCELPAGKYMSVLKAVKLLGGTVDKEVGNEYHLKAPLEVYGMPVTSIALNEGDEYIVEIKGVKTADVAKAVNATPGGRGFTRTTKLGILSVVDGEVGGKLMCETVMK